MLLLQVLSLRSRPMTWLVCWSLSARLKSHGKLLKDEVTSENLSPISGCAQLLEKVFFDFYRIHLIHFNPSLIVFDQFHHPPVKKKWSCTEGKSSHHQHENGFFLPLGSTYGIARSLLQLSILKTDSRQRSPWKWEWFCSVITKSRTASQTCAPFIASVQENPSKIDTLGLSGKAGSESKSTTKLGFEAQLTWLVARPKGDKIGISKHLQPERPTRSQHFTFRIFQDPLAQRFKSGSNMFKLQAWLCCNELWLTSQGFRSHSSSPWVPLESPGAFGRDRGGRHRWCAGIWWLKLWRFDVSSEHAQTFSWVLVGWPLSVGLTVRWCSKAPTSEWCKWVIAEVGMILILISS